MQSLAHPSPMLFARPGSPEPGFSFRGQRVSDLNAKVERLTKSYNSLSEHYADQAALYKDALETLEVFQRRAHARVCLGCEGKGYTAPGHFPESCEDCRGTGFSWDAI